MLNCTGCFRSESVSSGNPDKICDHISRSNFSMPSSRKTAMHCVACETFAADNKILVGAGEFRTARRADFDAICQQAPCDRSRVALWDVGYNVGDGYRSPQDCRSG